jgi:hypothetical protein
MRIQYVISQAIAKGILVQGTVTCFLDGEDGLFHPEWMFINGDPRIGRQPVLGRHRL